MSPDWQEQDEIESTDRCYHCRLVRPVALVLMLLMSKCGWTQWSGFLGTGGNPVIADAVIPDRFSVESSEQPSVNIAWKRDIAGRCVSGPIVVGNRVITTSSSAMEGRWGNTVAIDKHSGRLLWQRSIKTTGRPYCHPTSANAAPTPCTDGQHIFAFFSSNDLVCYDLDGQLQWFRSLTDTHPLTGNDVGMSCSPIVAEGVVVVNVECQADSFLTGIDVKSGETLWEQPRPRKANWSSPASITTDDGRTLVLVHSGEGALALDPRNGSTLWSLDERCSTIATAACVDGRLFLPAGGVKAYRIKNSTETPSLEWASSRLSPSSTSLAIVGSLGVLGLNRSVLACCDFQGELRWQSRLTDAGQFWSTPIVAGNRLFAVDSKGKCFVVDLTEESGTVVSVGELGQEVLGSPAADESGIYVRSTSSLWKIRQL